MNVYDFAIESLATLRPGMLDSTPAENRYNLIVNEAIMGEIAVFNMCYSQYQPWWDGVEDMIVNPATYGF